MRKRNLKKLLIIITLSSFISCAHTVVKPVIIKPIIPSCTTTGVVMQYKNYLMQIPRKFPRISSDDLIDLLFCLIETEQTIDSLGTPSTNI